MGNLFAELKRRHIYRVAAAYVVVAWIVLQAVNNLAPGLNLPNSAVTLVIVLLAIGFPIALIFAWILHLASTDSAKPKSGAADWVLAGALIAVLAVIFYQQMTAPTQQPQAPAPIAAAAAPAPAAPAQAISVAVLPFVNLSPDKDQEFFSDGMTEEITSALAKISGLRVVGRTSAFQFKGENKDLRAIGRALAATHLIEGSVRKDGNEVRITAQLITAGDGTHLWTESYNRELTGVFALQEEIATAIAASLRVPLGLNQGESLVSNRTGDTASYQDYLRAKALYRLRGGKALTDAAALLEQVVARDPDYAPAWGLLALASVILPSYQPAYLSGAAADMRSTIDASLKRADEAAQRAIQLDPKSADGYEALGLVEDRRGKPLAAEELYTKALAFDPNNPDILHQYSQLLAEVGRIKDAIVMQRRLRALDPLLPVYNSVNGAMLWIGSENTTAIDVFRDLPADFVLGKIFLAQVYSALDRYEEAAKAIEAIPPGALLPSTADNAARLLRTAPASAAMPENLPRLGLLQFVYLRIGAQSRVLDFYESALDAGYSDSIFFAFLWHPSYAEIRKTQRFKTFVRKAGLVDYWRAKGWPGQCQPTTGEDFACD